MRYVSVDIETTGLDDANDLVLQVAAIVDDSTRPDVPIEALPVFERKIRWKRITGDPFALSMHPMLLRSIANDRDVISPDELAPALRAWLLSQGFTAKQDIVSFTAAGKNFAGFDKLFLRRLPNWSTLVKPHHRAADPTILFFDPANDLELPSLDTCLKRAGVTGSVQHDAVSDAKDVIRTLRAGWAVNANRYVT